jgi:hypothetical protein
MGPAAPLDSGPVAAEVSRDIERKDGQAAEPSQTASEYVEFI